MRDTEALVKRLNVVVGCVVCVALGACSIKGPEVSVRPPVEIKVEDRGADGRGCPPGLAKQGRC
jgi:hypothetical protein